MARNKESLTLPIRDLRLSPTVGVHLDMQRVFSVVKVLLAYKFLKVSEFGRIEARAEVRRVVIEGIGQQQECPSQFLDPSSRGRTAGAGRTPDHSGRNDAASTRGEPRPPSMGRWRHRSGRDGAWRSSTQPQNRLTSERTQTTLCARPRRLQAPCPTGCSSSATTHGPRAPEPRPTGRVPQVHAARQGLLRAARRARRGMPLPPPATLRTQTPRPSRRRHRSRPGRRQRVEGPGSVRLRQPGPNRQRRAHPARPDQQMASRSSPHRLHAQRREAVSRSSASVIRRRSPWPRSDPPPSPLGVPQTGPFRRSRRPDPGLAAGWVRSGARRRGWDGLTSISAPPRARSRAWLMRRAQGARRGPASQRLG